jgi:hypothetical protein
MSELNPKLDTEPLTLNQPPTNPFHDTPDPTGSEDAGSAEPKVQSSEMTAHVIDDIPRTSPSAAQGDSAAQQHQVEPTPTAERSPPPSVAPPTTQDTAPVDGRIAGLVAIFPTFDHDLLRDVLNECNNNEEQAVDVLLGMSDPNHVPSTNVANVSRSMSTYSFFWHETLD